MNASAQLQMFEPEGKKLADLARTYLTIYDTELRRSENLFLSGFESTAKSRLVMAADAIDNAVICEMALTFEQLAGLS